MDHVKDDSCRVTVLVQWFRLRQSAPGARFCRLLRTWAGYLGYLSWQPHVDGKTETRKWPYVAPAPLPLVAAPRLSINLARAGESVGTRGPLVPSGPVELWSPIYLVRGMSL